MATMDDIARLYERVVELYQDCSPDRWDAGRDYVRAVMEYHNIDITI